MAATAYAAAVSLINTMDQIKIHPFLSTYFNINYSIESLREKVDFLVDFLEKYSDAESREAEDLLRRIADVAHETEEIINVEATNRINRTPSTVKSVIMTRKLKKKAQEMDRVKEKAVKAKEEIGFRNPFASSSSSLAPPANAKTTSMVGFDGYLEQLLDQLTGHHSGRQILPIVGMGGIGKTTLATNVYQHSLVLHHFDIRAWITVSQEFSSRNIILQALSCLGGGYTSKIDISESDDELGGKLYKVLSGRRYLIVLDDIWSVEAWEKIRFFFPENNNRSRIVVTTRESELVDYFGSSAVAVDFLDEKNSWELFCEKTFAQQGWPHPELENIGKKIVKKCKGLPLAISVIGGLLGKSSKTREYWEKIAEDKSLILDSGEGNTDPLSILYLSYKHLPVWLKSCFLYLGLFPEDHEIEVSRLIKLWVAEGFIKAKSGQSLEEVAESYTTELVDRNLLIVSKLRKNKKLKRCKVHDFVRELCIRIAEKEKYFCVQRDIDRMRHYIVDEPTARLLYPQESQEMSPSIVRPLILKRRMVAPFKSRLLRVLVCDSALDYYSQQANLRFLCYGGHNRYERGTIGPSILRLWSLQTLIVSNQFTAPREIWEMPQLRHIEIESIHPPCPPSLTFDGDIIILENLQTLGRVKNLVLSEEVCKRMPNIKELGVSYNLFSEPCEASRCDYHLHNLGRFNKLESLRLSCSNGWKYPRGDSLHGLKLPSSLKELSLSGCKLVWTDMAMIASLPHLQILKFGDCAVVIPEWDFVEGGFLSLKHLQVDDCDDLINWSTADSSSFPVLETLSLNGLFKLKEIPSDIGEIPTLERIRIYRCNKSITMSAIKILEEQESLGNQSLQLQLKFLYECETTTLRKEIEEMGITCQNLHIHTVNVQ